MEHKTHLYRFLMISSLLLLLVFEVYWLRKVYREQKELLGKDIDNLFVQNIREQQDSLFRQHMVVFRDSLTKSRASTIITFSTDSIAKPPAAANTERNQTFIIRLDSVRNGHDLNHQQARYQPGRSSEPESRLQRRERIFRNTIAAVKDGNQGSFWGGMNFIGPHNDTLRLDLLQSRIQSDMTRAGLLIPVKISRPDTVPDINTMAGIATFYPAGFPPIHLYVAQATGYQSYLFRKMAPSLLFALFLLGITSVSFFLIFRSLQEQQKLAKLKNDFISNITHELKTPISTVSVALEALQNFQVLNNPEKTREYLSISQHELHRLSILVDRVLKMSMFEQKALHLHPERFDLKATLQKVIESMGLQFEKVRAKVNLQVEGEQFMVEGDPVHLTNVLYNLLDNALKYSKQQPEINIALREHNGMVQISVQDNGIGIAKEYQHKIFEQFFRVPQNGNQHNTKGHGLGLSYVSEVLKSHHGSITLESAPGKGSTFMVNIPKLPAAG